MTSHDIPEAVSWSSCEQTNIAVIIPAYKAESTIRDVVVGLPSWIDNIIIVEDCSPDETIDIVYRLQENDNRVHVLRHQQNRGVGGAVISGYKEALKLNADIVVKMDSDGQMDPVYLPILIKPILNHKADYTKGNRFLHERELKNMPMTRRVGNLGLSFLTKLASGYWNIFDPTNGYTAISRETINLLNFERIDERFFFETSILIELGLHRAVVKDVGIPSIYGSEISSLSERRALFEFPVKLFQGLIRRIIIIYFLRDFTALTLFLTTGIFLSSFGLVWGVVNWVRSSITGIIATTGTVMVAVLPLILGIQFLLQTIVMDIQNIPSEVISNYD